METNILLAMVSSLLVYYSYVAYREIINCEIFIIIHFVQNI